MTSPRHAKQTGRGSQRVAGQESGPDLPAHAPSALEVPPWRGRFLLYLLGAALLAFGLRGIAWNVNGWTHPTYWAPVLVLFALAHDLLLVPLVFAAASVLGRLVREPARRYLAAGLALSGVTLALAWPGLRGYGRLPDNPSVLPLDYAAGLRTVLLILWLGLLAAFLVRALRDELRTNRPGPKVQTTTADDPRRP